MNHTFPPVAEPSWVNMVIISIFPSKPLRTTVHAHSDPLPSSTEYVALSRPIVIPTSGNTTHTYLLTLVVQGNKFLYSTQTHAHNSIWLLGVYNFKVMLGDWDRVTWEWRKHSSFSIYVYAWLAVYWTVLCAVYEPTDILIACHIDPTSQSTSPLALLATDTLLTKLDGYVYSLTLSTWT